METIKKKDLKEIFFENSFTLFKETREFKRKKRKACWRTFSLTTSKTFGSLHCSIAGAMRSCGESCWGACPVKCLWILPLILLIEFMDSGWMLNIRIFAYRHDIFHSKNEGSGWFNWSLLPSYIQVFCWFLMFSSASLHKFDSLV